MTYLTLALTVAIACTALLLAFLLHPRGIVQKLMESRGKQYENLQKNFLDVSNRLAQMEKKTEILLTVVDETKASLGRRLTALETLEGKARRKEEKARELEIHREMYQTAVSGQGAFGVPGTQPENFNGG